MVIPVQAGEYLSSTGGTSEKILGTDAFVSFDASKHKVLSKNVPVHKPSPSLGLNNNTKALTKVTHKPSAIPFAQESFSLSPAYYIFVCSALVLALVFFKRGTAKKNDKTKLMQVVEVLPLGQKDSLQLIDISGERFVIAKSANGISNVFSCASRQANYSASAPDLSAEAEQPSANVASLNTCSDKSKQQLNKKPGFANVLHQLNSAFVLDSAHSDLKMANSVDGSESLVETNNAEEDGQHVNV